MMSSPRSEATSTSDVSVISQWQDVLGLPVEISQRLSADEDFRVVVQHINDYIATNNASFEEYEQAIREFTSTVEERNRTLQTQAFEIDNLRVELSSQSTVVEELNKEKNELDSEIHLLQGEVESKSVLILTLQSQLEDANERLKPVPSIPGDRETLLRLLDRRQQEIDRLTDEWRNMLNKLEMSSAEKSNTQSKLDEIILQDSSAKLREQLFDQEKKLLQSQNEWLNSELNSKSEILLKLQKDRAQQVSVLESESLKLREEVKQLTSLLEAARKSKMDTGGRLEELRGIVSKGQEENMHIEEQFRKEISAQSKLVELYKSSCEEAEKRVQELVTAIERLQKLLETTTKEKQMVEEKLTNYEATNSSTIQELSDQVNSLTAELQKANELLTETGSKSSQVSQQQLAEIFPTAAATSSLLKSGMTLTQIYSKYAEVSDELIKEKEAKELIQNQLNYLIQELQDRTPVLQKQREDLDRVTEENKVLKSRYENAVEECEMLRLESDDASRQSALQEKENDRLKKLVGDLSKQVKVLLQECEEARGGGEGSHDAEMTSHDISSGDVSSSSEVISGHLVSFRNIDELQEQNQRLLMVIRDLSDQQERREQEMMDENHLQLKEQLKEAMDELGRLREARERQKEMVKAIVNQRDMYQRLLAQATPLPAAGDEDIIVSDGGSVLVKKSPQPDGTATELKELRERFEDYRKERLENEKILRVQVEEYREEASKLRLDNATIISKLEFTQERLKNIQSDYQDLKHENSLLKEREKVLSSSLDKYESKHRDLFQELLTVRAKLSKAEASCDNLRAEKQLISQAEQRATQLYQSLLKEQQNQNLVLVNLQTIQNNMERNEFQTRTKLEAQVASTERELALAKKKLEHEEEERDKRREAWEQRLEAVQGTLDNERSEHEECRNQLNQTKDQLSRVTEQLAANRVELEKQQQLLKESEEHLKKVEEDPKGELQKKIRILEKKLADGNSRTTGLESELSAAKQNAEQYQLAAQANEEALRDLNTAKEQYEEQMNKKTTELEEKKNELMSQLHLLQNKTTELESQLASQQEESTTEVTKLVQRISELEHEVAGCHGTIASLQEQQSSVNKVIEEHVAEKKKYKEAYDRELMQHGNTMQELVMVKQQLESEQESLAEADEAVKVAEEKLAVNDTAWQQKILSMETDNKKLGEKYEELLSQNERLHGQAEQLNAQLKVLQRQSWQEDDAVSIASGFSTTEKTAEELWDIIRYIRREKQISDTKMEMSQSQRIRLQESCDHLQRKLTETEKMLAEERERNTMNMKTAEEHTAILAKVEQLNLLSDSNKLLREQKNKLEQQLETSTSRVRELEGEVQPLKENIKMITVQKDALVAEKTALRNEVAKWNTRTTQLIERYNQVDPDEYKQLVEERDTRKQEITELKTQLESLRSELKSEQEAKKGLETEMNSISATNQTQLTTAEDKLKATQEELAKCEEEINKLNDSMKAKAVVVQKLQKVGRSYRMKYEEATKELEELKESTQSKEAATAASSAVQQSELAKKIEELEKENKELKESVETQKGSMAASENKLTEMKKTMKIAMQRFTDMKSEREKLDREVRKIGEERTANEQQLEELTKKLDAQKMDYEERISSLEERLRHYHHSPKPESRLTESTATATQTPSTLTVTLATPMATVKPTTSVKHSSSTRVSATPTASIRPLASTTQTPTAAVTPTQIATSNNSSQQQACVAPVAPVTTVTTISVTTVDTGSSSIPVGSVAMVTSGDVPTTTTASMETPLVATTTALNVVEPTTSLHVPTTESSSSSGDSLAVLHEPQETHHSSRESSVTPVVQQDSQLMIQPPVALKHAKPLTTAGGAILNISVPTVNIVRMKHPGISTYHSRVIKRQRTEEEEGSTDQERSSADSKKIKRDITTTEDTSGSVVNMEDIATGSTAGETTEEEQTGKELMIDPGSKDEDVTASIVSETTSEATSITVTAIDNIPLSSHITKVQEMETEAKAEDKEVVTEQEAMEQTSAVEEQEEDDDMGAASGSAATSEVNIDDEDDVEGEGDGNMADEAEEEETMEPEEEEVVEEEDEEDEEADDEEEEEEVDIEGFETGATTDVGLSKSDPIELSSDDEPPPVMLSSARDTHIKLEQPDDDESSIVLRMVDEINEAASSSVIDIGSDLMSGIHDDARDDGGDADMLPHYGDPLQMPLSDDVLPITRDDTEPSMSSTETQPQAEVPRHVRPQTMATRPQPSSLHEVTSDRLVPHTPVFGDTTLVTPTGFPAVPVGDQPRLVGSQLTSSTQVATVPSLEAGDMLLTSATTGDRSVPEPVVLPTVHVEPPAAEDQSGDHHVSQQQDDHVTTTTTTTAQSSTAAWSPEEGELEDVEEDTIKVTADSDDELSVKSVTKVTLVGESAAGTSEVKETTKESDQASSEEGSSGKTLVGSSSATQQSTATSKGSANTEQSGRRATSTRRKIQPVVWDKGSQGQGSSSSSTAVAGATGRGAKLKRGGDAPRRGRGVGRGGRKTAGTKK